MSHDPADESRRIQEELEYQLGLRGTSAAPLDISLVDLERTAFVCAGAPDVGGRRTGAVARLVRRAMFKLTRWYVEPFVLQQRSFNLALVRYIADLERRLAEQEGERPSGGR